jgi:hypothetical protein
MFLVCYKTILAVPEAGAAFAHPSCHRIFFVLSYLIIFIKYSEKLVVERWKELPREKTESFHTCVSSGETPLTGEKAVCSCVTGKSS